MKELVHPLDLGIFNTNYLGRKPVAIRGDDVKKSIKLSTEFIVKYRGKIGNPIFYGQTPKRADEKDLFIMHFDGKVKWKLQIEGSVEEIVLAPGDMLYIPAGVLHSAEPLEPQLAVGFRKNNPKPKNNS